MRVAALFSGGKDSTYAVFWALHQGWELVALLAVFVEGEDSYMYHIPGITLTKLAAEALEVPLIKVHTTGEKEMELAPLRDALATLEIDGIVTGALGSEYQRRRFDMICEQLAIKSFAPMWHKNPLKLLREMVQEGYEIIVVGCSAYGIDESWLGRRLDEACINALVELEAKYRINITGEGGEFETIVLDAPDFKKRIVIETAEKAWHRARGTLQIKKARLVDKG